MVPFDQARQHCIWEDNEAFVGSTSDTHELHKELQNVLVCEVGFASRQHRDNGGENSEVRTGSDSSIENAVVRRAKFSLRFC